MTPHGVQRDAIATREPRGFFIMTPGVFHLGFFDVLRDVCSVR